MAMIRSTKFSSTSLLPHLLLLQALLILITSTVHVSSTITRKLDETSTTPDVDQSKCGGCPCGNPCGQTPPSPPPPSPPPPPPPPEVSYPPPPYKKPPSSVYCPPPPTPTSPSGGGGGGGGLIYIAGPPGNLYPIDHTYGGSGRMGLNTGLVGLGLVVASYVIVLLF